MPKVKMPRKSTLIDMTAMCDVAFLLLTFFEVLMSLQLRCPTDHAYEVTFATCGASSCSSSSRLPRVVK